MACVRSLLPVYLFSWVSLTGSAGQSMGAFLLDGLEIDLQGEANDYVSAAKKKTWMRLFRRGHICVD